MPPRTATSRARSRTARHWNLNEGSGSSLSRRIRQRHDRRLRSATRPGSRASCRQFRAEQPTGRGQRCLRHPPEHGARGRGAGRPRQRHRCRREPADGLQGHRPEPRHGHPRRDGGFTYTPRAGYAGPDSFTYRANDGTGELEYGLGELDGHGTRQWRRHGRRGRHRGLRGGAGQTAALINALPTATAFTLGDNAYDTGTIAQYNNCYEPTWGAFKARTYPSIGNHDAPNQSTGYFPYFSATPGGVGSPNGYYSYNQGPYWHVIVLNSEINYAAGSTQEQWLRADLAANSTKNVLAYWHQPRFSSDSVHGTAVVGEAMWDALYEFGADLVLNGHAHWYERYAPQTPDGVADPTYGIRQFTVGTGGRSSARPRDDRSEQRGPRLVVLGRSEADPQPVQLRLAVPAGGGFELHRLRHQRRSPRPGDPHPQHHRGDPGQPDHRGRCDPAVHRHRHVQRRLDGEPHGLGHVGLRYARRGDDQLERPGHRRGRRHEHHQRDPGPGQRQHHPDRHRAIDLHPVWHGDRRRAGLPGAAVHVFDCGHRRLRRRRRDRAGGVYSFSLPAGTYKLFVQPDEPGYADQWYGGPTVRERDGRSRSAPTRPGRGLPAGRATP